MKQPIYTIVLLFFSFFQVFSQTNWTNGAGDNDWFNPTNWDSGLPASGNDANISSTGTPVFILTANYTIDFTINNDGVININASAFSVINNGTINNAGVFSNNGTFENHNIFVNTGNVTNYSVIINIGDFTNDQFISNGGDFIHVGTATLTNNGYIQNVGAGIFVTYSDFFNSAGSAIDNFSIFINSAHFQNEGFFANSTTFHNQPAGNLENIGTFNNTDSLNNEGIINNLGNFSTTNDLQNSGTITNENTFSMNGILNNSGQIFNNVTFFNNSGTLTNDVTGTITNDSLFTNQGSINNDGLFLNTSCHLFIAQNASNSTNGAGVFTNDGIVKLIGSGTVDVTDGSGTVITGLWASPQPDAICAAPFEIFLDATGNASITVDDIDNGSTADYCYIADRSISKSDFTCNDIGDNQITLTITDGLGNTNTCITTVTVSDNIPPAITCPEDMTFQLGEGECGIEVDFIDQITASDICANPPTITQVDNSGLASGDFFPIGVTSLEFEISDGFNIVTCSFNINVIEFDNGSSVMVCNDMVSISLDNQDCVSEISPDMILEGQYGCWDDYLVNINGTGSNIITADNIGDMLTVWVTDTDTGNSCWGKAIVEDKAAPSITGCEPDTIYCVQNSDPVTEGGEVPAPQFFDCSNYTFSHSDSHQYGECEDGFLNKIDRLWLATDEFGWTSTCSQEIVVKRVLLEENSPVCPDDVLLECSESGAPSTDPENTGYPYFSIDGVNYDITQDNDMLLCGVSSAYTDIIIANCGSGYEIIRTWLIMDECSEMTPGVNPWTCHQTIKYKDTTPPVIQAPQSITLSTDATTCTSTGYIPPVSIDDCSNFSVTIFTPVGVIEGNGGNIPTIGLPVGGYEITYVATDECANQSSVTVPLFIEDLITPVPVCDEITQVGVTSNGEAVIFAETFDDGSLDNCCLDHFEVRRMSSYCTGHYDDLSFGESVTFCCDDIGNTIDVIFRVFDCFGNHNDCMVEVLVEDKQSPQCIAPPSQTISCTELSDNLDINNSNQMNEYFGTPYAIDNCSAQIEYLSTLDYRSDCGFGYFIRRFRAFDTYGNVSTMCTQTITVDEIHDYTINIPSDVMSDCSNPNIPALAIDDEGCDLFAINIENQIYPIADDTACYKILRTYDILNWCEWDGVSEATVLQRIDYNSDGLFDAHPIHFSGLNNSGHYQYTQVIKVFDNNLPEVSFTGNTEFCAGLDSSHGEGACEGYAELSVEVTDECTTDVSAFWQIDLNNDGDTNDWGETGNGFSFAKVLETGDYEILFYGEDACGNVNGPFSISFSVVDCKKPTVFCDEIVAQIMDGDSPVITLSPEQFLQEGCNGNCVTDNCPGDLLLSFSSNINDTEKTFTCDNMGMNPIEIWVTDAAGNQDFCQTFVEIQSNTGICDGIFIPMISGVIETEANEGVENVNIELNNQGNVFNTITDSDGNFNIQIEGGYDYTVVPYLNDNPHNGISTYDLVLMSKHILGINPLDSPYKIIAADINNSGTVSTFDMVELRKLILYVYDDLPENTSWRFINSSYEFSNPQNPFAEQFPEILNFNNVSEDIGDANFIAVKTGDLNGSATPNSLLGIEDRDGEKTFTIFTDEQEIRAGEQVQIDLFAKDLDGIAGTQFTLNFDERYLQFENIIQGVASLRNFGFSLIDRGVITFSWDNSESINTSNTKLFSLSFIANENSRISEVLNINSMFTKAEAYNNNGDLYEINFRIKSPWTDVVYPERLKLYQNVPNPFTGTTMIKFYLPEATNATLSVFDVSGKELYKIEKGFSKGFNEINIESKNIQKTGLLYYRLKTATEVATKKMILTKK